MRFSWVPHFLVLVPLFRNTNLQNNHRENSQLKRKMNPNILCLFPLISKNKYEYTAHVCRRLGGLQTYYLSKHVNYIETGLLIRMYTFPSDFFFKGKFMFQPQNSFCVILIYRLIYFIINPLFLIKVGLVWFSLRFPLTSWCCSSTC